MEGSGEQGRKGKKWTSWETQWLSLGRSEKNRKEDGVKYGKRKLLEEEIEDDRSTRNRDRGQLNKWKKPLLDSLEHRMRRKERQVGEAWKKWIKLT
jgi:hypothetical protein